MLIQELIMVDVKELQPSISELFGNQYHQLIYPIFKIRLSYITTWKFNPNT